MAAMLAVVEPGDEVIVFEPFYENYVPDAAMSGAKLVFVTLHGADFTFDPDELRARLLRHAHAPSSSTRRTTRAARSSPATSSARSPRSARSSTPSASPTRSTSTSSTTATSTSPWPRCPGMYERTITISGLSKTFSVTGWRLGYVLARPPSATPSARCTISSPSARRRRCRRPPRRRYGASRRVLRRTARHATRVKRDMLLASLREAGFHCHSPAGGLLHHGRLLGPRIRRRRHRLRPPPDRDIGVAPVPGSSFYRSSEGARFVRFTFSKSEETLAEAARRLATR